MFLINIMSVLSALLFCFCFFKIIVYWNVKFDCIMFVHVIIFVIVEHCVLNKFNSIQ